MFTLLEYKLFVRVVFTNAILPTLDLTMESNQHIFTEKSTIHKIYIQ